MLSHDAPLPITHAMAQFAMDTTWHNLPVSVKNEGVRAWLNWVACATGGAVTPSVDTAIKGLLSMGGGHTPLLGRTEQLSLPDAALLGSLSAAAHTYDDTHLATITHPTGPVASALLACAHQLSAQNKPVDGQRLLTALIIGLEIECRVSCAIAATGGNQGWYMTGLSGGIGASLAVAKLLGLSKTQMIYSIGLAATQASGLRATHGAMAINFVPGIAARDGLVAAYLAAAHYTCRDVSIDGKNGLLQVLTHKHDGSLIGYELGERFEMMNNAYKPYPCGIVIHPSIDACLHLVNVCGIKHQDIKKIELVVHKDALNLCWRKLPDNVLDAQVSLFHWVGIALSRGAAGVREGELACVLDIEARALQDLACAQSNSDLADNQAIVRLTLKNGAIVEQKTENAIGSKTNPMTSEQLNKKFDELVMPVLGKLKTDILIDQCWDIAKSTDVASLLQTAHT